MTTPVGPTDVILTLSAINSPNSYIRFHHILSNNLHPSVTRTTIQSIVSRTKTHLFQKHLLPPTIRRIWIYQPSPISSLTHILLLGDSAIRPAPPSTYDPTPLNIYLDAATWRLPMEGQGNVEWNYYHEDYEGLNCAYPILGVWRLWEPVGVKSFEGYGMSQRGLNAGIKIVSEGLKRAVRWDEQECLWTNTP